ncbi:hypothetical protein NPIL_335211 [Nephila pilipes]|uniref:Uncharacterized protein n=1 Tax=Nephila pilipes TaxID=299642 RepID=A0A8X6NI13_NEPPI|nr:hypothetical protein NPIL_335211 [Nephila pilipes]
MGEKKRRGQKTKKNEQKKKEEKNVMQQALYPDEAQSRRKRTILFERSVFHGTRANRRRAASVAISRFSNLRWTATEDDRKMIE